MRYFTQNSIQENIDSEWLLCEHSLKHIAVLTYKNCVTCVQGATRRQRRGGIDGEPTSNGSSAAHHTKKLRFQLAKERKASTTLGIIMSAFTVCWLPFFVLALVRPFLTKSDSIPSSLSRCVRALGAAPRTVPLSKANQSQAKLFVSPNEILYVLNLSRLPRVTEYKAPVTRSLFTSS